MAEHVLLELGEEDGFSLDVRRVGDVYQLLLHDGFPAAPEETLHTESGEGAEPGVIAVLAVGGDGSSVTVQLPDSLPDAEAVAMLADVFQDEVLEHRFGAPLPRCPGHAHPAVAEVVEGVACWVCPRGGGSARPVLS
ncbi:hypothetical protein [Nocardiopsis sp. FR6]|uniref:hypothetical protein n=1 Tax=Nocardiopsis sp. FR6 TaxID=2605986 RepID=UPI001358045E|nr:hypothetical protein [Nocardiopsis sp. FR6]